MIRIFKSQTVFATICFLFAMAVLVSSFAGGSLPRFGSNSVLVQPAFKAADDGPFFPPDPYEDDHSAPKRADIFFGSLAKLPSSVTRVGRSPKSPAPRDNCIGVGALSRQDRGSAFQLS